MEFKACDRVECLCKSSQDWGVNSPEYGNCFWKYLEDNQRTHTLSEISKLLDMSISAITAIEKKVIQKIKVKLARND